MNPKNLISIIIPFLNAEKFIQEAIESVLAQTYSNWELLLIDDGSTDGSTKIARQYAEQYPEKVRYVEHEEHKNRGQSVSRNTGINKSHGEYIAFLDADDVWLPQTLKEQIEIMDSHPEVAMVCGPALYWNSWKGNKRDYTQNLDVEYDSVAKPHLLLRKLIQQQGYEPLLGSLIIRRKAVNRRGGFEESISAIMCDLVFLIKIFVAEPVFVSRQVWFKYRLRPDSVCHSYKKEYDLTEERFWKWVKQYLTNEGIKDEETWSIVEEQNRRYGPQ